MMRIRLYQHRKHGDNIAMVYWELIITLAVAMLGSSGIWGYMSLRMSKKDNTSDMIKGVAQHMIIREGTRLIDQGYVTMDEYRNLHKGLYRPYTKLGGNGLAQKMVAEVEKLPIVKGRIDNE